MPYRTEICKRASVGCDDVSLTPSRIRRLICEEHLPTVTPRTAYKVTSYHYTDFTYNLSPLFESWHKPEQLRS